MFSVTPENRSPINEIHTINTQLVSAMSTFTLELTLGYQLAIANEPLVSKKLSEVYVPQSPVVSLMDWRSHYFDTYQRLVLPFHAHVTKLEHFAINGIDFLAVCTRPLNVHLLHDHPSKRQPSTLIYRLYFGGGTLDWRLQQELGLRVSFDARAFELRSSNNAPGHNYIAFIGQEPLSNFPQAGHSTESMQAGSPQLGLVVYKYFGGVFALTKFIPAPGSVKLDAISYNPGSHAVIAVALHSSPHVLLFSFDGTQLRQLPGPMPISRPINLHLFPRPQPQQGFRLTQAKRTLDSNSTKENVEESAESSEIDWKPALVFSTSEDVKEIVNDKVNLANISDNDEDDDLAIGKAVNAAENFVSNQANKQNSTISNQTTDNIYDIKINDSGEYMGAIGIHDGSSEDYDRVVSDLNSKYNITSIETSNSSSIDKRQFIPTLNLQQDLLGWCNARLNELKRDNFNSISQQLQSLSRLVETPSGQFVEYSGDLIVDGDMEVTEQLNAGSIIGALNPNGKPSSVETLLYEQQTLLQPEFDAAVSSLHELINELKIVTERVDELLVDDGTLQDVHTAIEFDNLIVDCQDWGNAQTPHNSWNLVRNCPHIQELNTPIINSNNISNIHESVLVTGRPIAVNRDVRFERLVLQGDTHIQSRLNGFMIDDIVFKRQQRMYFDNNNHLLPQAVNNQQMTHFIGGHKDFAGGLYINDANLHVKHWNGEQVNEQTVLTASQSEQHIETELRVNRIILANSPVRQLSPQNYSVSSASSHITSINNLPLNTFFNSLVTSDEASSIDAPLYIDELELNGPVELAHSMRNGGAFISGIDLNDLWNNVLLKHSPQNITAPMHFANLHVWQGSDIRVNGLVNGIDFSSQNILLKSSNIIFKGPVRIIGDVQVQNELHVGKALNGIQVLPPLSPIPPKPMSTRPELAIMLDYGDQVVTGNKILDRVTLAGNTTIKGPINGYIDLEQLYRLVVRTNESFRFEKVRLTGSEIKRLAPNYGSLHISRSINGIPVADVCRTASMANSLDSQVRYSRIRLEDAASFKNLQCASINGFTNLRDNFLLRNSSEPQHVKGTIRFNGGVTFNSSLLISRQLNNMDAYNLTNAIRTQLTETVTQRKVVYGDLTLDQLYADRIDNINLQDVFIANSRETQIINSPMTIDDLDIENTLTINSNARFGSFNNINVSDVFFNTLQYDTPQVINAPVEVTTLRLTKNSRLATNALNGVDLRAVLSDAVLVDVPQQIIGPKTFIAPVDLRGKCYMRHTINGLSHEDLRLSYLLNSDDPSIDGDIIFNSDVVVNKELEIDSGLINDININSFADSVLYENRTRLNKNRPLPMIVQGQNSSVTFRNLMVNNLVVGGAIQGVDIAREMNRHQTMPNQTNPYPNIPITIFKAPIPPQNQNFNASSLPALWIPQPDQQTLQQPHLYPLPESMKQPATQLYSTETSARAFNPAVQQTQKNDELEQSILQFEAFEISKLATRISPLVPLALYYSIFEMHAFNGPFLHAAENPESSRGSLLLLKSVGQGEDPCTQSNQSIAVWQQQSTSLFAQNSVLTEVSKPTLVSSIALGGRQFLFVANIVGHKKEVLVYTWHLRTSRYEIVSSFLLPDYPTDMQAFSFKTSGLICIAIAMPRAVINRQHKRGAPTIYCESDRTRSQFNIALTLTDHVGHVFKLSTLHISSGEQVLLAALSHVETSRLGDLTLWLLDSLPDQIRTRQTPEFINFKLVASRLAPRRVIQPLAVHLFTDSPNSSGLSGAAGQVVARVAVSGAATTTDSTTTGAARTKLYALESWRTRLNDRLRPNSTRLVESQVIRDASYTDIQSVPLTMPSASYGASLLFMQSTHFISIFAPSKASNSFECATKYDLIQRLPTKGATKFSVFVNEFAIQNKSLSTYDATGRQTNSKNFAQHLLALSRDDCSSQEFSTVILKSNFANYSK